MPSIQQDILWDDINDKWSLISESVTTIQICVHPTGKEPDPHVVRLASQVTRTSTVREVPTKSNLGPYSQDEILAPAQPIHRRGPPHGPSKKTPWSRKVRFDKVVTGPHKPDMQSVQIKDCPSWPKQRGPYLTQTGATAMESQNSHGSLPTLPFWVIHFPLFVCPVTPAYMNINIASTQRNQHILLVHEKEVLHLSGTYHSSSIDVYQLSISYLVVNINTSTTRITYIRVLPCNLSPSYKTVHVVHNQHMQR
jgi:hypothetical protein